MIRETIVGKKELKGIQCHDFDVKVLLDEEIDDDEVVIEKICKLCKEQDFWFFLEMLQHFKQQMNIDRLDIIIGWKDLEAEKRNSIVMAITKIEGVPTVRIPDWTKTRESLIFLGSLNSLCHEYTHLLCKDFGKNETELHDDGFFEKSFDVHNRLLKNLYDTVYDKKQQKER